MWENSKITVVSLQNIYLHTLLLRSQWGFSYIHVCEIHSGLVKCPSFLLLCIPNLKDGVPFTAGLRFQQLNI